VLIHKIFENHQSDPVLIRPFKTMHFILPHLPHEKNRHSLQAFPKFNMAVPILPPEAKALQELFCH